MWQGGRDAIGVARASNEWYFAEGCTRDGFGTWICLENPDDRPASVGIHYYCGDGQTETRSGISISGKSHVTVPVHETGLGIGRHNDTHGDFSIKVESLGGVPIVAERSMYFAYRSQQPDWRTIDRNALAAAWGWGEI